MGVDIILDANYNPFLLEMNINPAIFTDCNTLQEMLP
jgi:D-alanine-D-alanine ligase-like ATP-grasp enzyme